MVDASKRVDLCGERFRAVYELSRPTGHGPLSEGEALALAEDICIEQTVEFPRDLVSDPWIRTNIFGRVESLLAGDVGAPWKATVSYAVETSGFELPQLLNVLFGNISLKMGIRLIRMELTGGFASALPGPRFGRAGLRRILGVPRRPLLCTALKPMGLTAAELAELAYRLARGGIDLIKDDHGLADQSFCPFEERLERCARAIDKANSEVGGHCRYLPNITAPSSLLADRARRARDAGAGGLMVSPGLTGFDAMRELAQDDGLGLPVISHPALLGSYVSSPVSGIAHPAIFGQIMRLAGADACIVPHAGGRFPFTPEDCRALARGTAMDMDWVRPIFPVPAGGMRIARVTEMIDFYGNDVILLIGGDLHRQGPDLERNCRELLQKVEEYRDRTSDGT